MSSTQSYEWINKKDSEGIVGKSTFGRSEWNEDSIIANMEKTIKRLGEENSAGKRCIAKMKQRKKGNIWCYVCTMCIFFISIFILSANMQIRTNKRTYLP